MLSSRECPDCFAAIEDSSAQRCGYCGSELFKDSLADLGQFDPDEIKKYLKFYTTLINEDAHHTEALRGLGLCYLKMGIYPLAQQQFEQVIEIAPDDAPAYYYYVLASVKGRRLKTLRLSEARLFEQYLLTALQLDNQAPQYRLLLAMLKRDYYEVNGMKVSPPNAAELLKDLYLKEIDEEEAKYLEKSVKVSGQEEYFKGLSKKKRDSTDTDRQ
ncbi:hypothetical protein F4167_11975 [Candidatus Poribacteria bacterium]|nr:hypothetical protein [Candidatus Poribacteria bacterium]MYG07309.1 hypothetical protein [Candidatus Poribacteria bacterium]